MKILQFTYTRKDNKVTERVVMPLVEPVKFYEGIDMSELSQEEIGEFVGKYNRLYDNFMLQVSQLKNEYDLNESYRRFDPERMTDVEIEVI